MQYFKEVYFFESESNWLSKFSLFWVTYSHIFLLIVIEVDQHFSYVRNTEKAVSKSHHYLVKIPNASFSTKHVQLDCRSQSF